MTDDDELRLLEARLDARLQEVNARIVLHDARFAAMGDRINQTDYRGDSLSARIDSRLRGIDSRLDHIELRIQQYRDLLHDELITSQRVRWWPKRRQ